MVLATHPFKSPTGNGSPSINPNFRAFRFHASEGNVQDNVSGKGFRRSPVTANSNAKCMHSIASECTIGFMGQGIPISKWLINIHVR